MTTGQLESSTAPSSSDEAATETDSPSESKRETEIRKVLKRMRLQIWAGALGGFCLALVIGAAFIAVVSTSECQHPTCADPQFYTKLVDLWAKTEQIWEGVFSIVASLIILVMGTAFLKMDQSRVKWRFKLARAFDRSLNASGQGEAVKTKGEKWALFLLPFITVVRVRCHSLSAYDRHQQLTLL